MGGVCLHPQLIGPMWLQRPPRSKLYFFFLFSRSRRSRERHWCKEFRSLALCLFHGVEMVGFNVE